MVIRKVSEHIGSIKDDQDKLVISDRDKANVLNTFFSTVFTDEKEGYNR